MKLRSINMLLIFFAFCFFSTPTQAQLTFTAGLDKGTRELVESLPENLRKSLLKALEDALPIINKSVSGYLDQVNKIISDSIASGATAVQCGTAGTVNILQSEMSSSLANILYTGRRTGLNERSIGNYTEAYSNAITTARANVTAKTEATEILTAYSDLLIRGAIIKCAANMNPELLHFEPDAQIRRISMPALEWNILIGNRDKPYCRKIHDCVIKRRRDFTIYMEKADPRDKEVSDATLLLKTIPDTPDPPKSFIPLIDPGIKILDYEEILMSLRSIERAVEAAKATRQSRAANHWSEAEKKRDEALQIIQNDGKNINFRFLYPKVITLLELSIRLAQEASKEDYVFSKRSKELINDINSHKNRAAELKKRDEDWYLLYDILPIMMRGLK